MTHEASLLLWRDMLFVYYYTINYCNIEVEIHKILSASIEWHEPLVEFMYGGNSIEYGKYYRRY